MCAYGTCGLSVERPGTVGALSSYTFETVMLSQPFGQHQRVASPWTPIEEKQHLWPTMLLRGKTQNVCFTKYI